MQLTITAGSPGIYMISSHSQYISNKAPTLVPQSTRATNPVAFPNFVRISAVTDAFLLTAIKRQ